MKVSHSTSLTTALFQEDYGVGCKSIVVMVGGGNQDSQWIDTEFMNYTGVPEAFLSSNEESRTAWIKAKQTQPLHIEELPKLKLVFANEVRQPMYTGKSITDKNKMPIKIQLIDINTGRQCTNVEGFNIKVNIVVIDGDLELEGLDTDKFKRKIVKQREGKRPLLIGNTEVTFNQQGVGTIRDIYFTDNSKWLRSGKFRLGACIDSKRCGTIINIQEGLSEKFKVKDQRGLPYEKHYPPMLNDDVWRLESIAKNGKYHQKLKDKNINSVQDLLKLLNSNPNGLKEEILNMKTNAWNKVVKHAQTCRMELDNANLENNADLPSEAFGEMPKQTSTVQGMTMDNDSNLNQGLDFDGLDLDGLDLDGLDFNGLDFDGLDLDGLDFDGFDQWDGGSTSN